MSVKLLTYDVYRSGMTLFKDLADSTYQDKVHLPAYYLRKVAQSEVPTGFDSAYRLIYRVSGDPDEHVQGDTIGIMGSQGGGIIQTYIIEGSTPMSDTWLTDVPGGDPIVPTKEFLYLILSPGQEFNNFYRYDDSAHEYVQVLDAKGAGAIFCNEITGKTPFASDWLTDSVSSGMTVTPLVPKAGILYLDISPGKYQNMLFRYDPVATTYIPLTSAGTGIIFAYEVAGKTPLASDWLTDTVGGTSITPDPDYLYLDLTVGKYENYIFRYNSTLHSYVPVSGGSGSGAIYSYIVGSKAFASNWLSESPGGTPLTPEAGPLYLVLTAGAHYSAFYRYDETNHVYILVSNARVVDMTKAEYLALPEAKQKDGTIYYITDSATSTPGKDDYIPARVTVPENPATGFVMLWKGAVTSVFTISPAFYKYNGTTWVRDNLGIEGQTIQVDTMPVPTLQLVGQVLQYIGASSNGYVHNFFYECVNNSGTYQWVNAKVQAGDEFQVETMPTPSADYLGKVYQYLGNTTADYIHSYFYECVSDGSNYAWQNVKVQPGEKTQFTTLPLPSADLVGSVFQYVGVTNASYTHNYFYECVTDGTTYSWENTKVQPGEKLQFTTLPTASADLVGSVFQYTGTTTSTYVHNCFYECINDSGTYKWEQSSVEIPETKEMSLADFDVLPEAQKNDGTAYFIPDAEFSTDYVIRTGFTPIGTVISVMGTAAPDHYVICDGSEVSIELYPELADYFESQYGSCNYFGGDGVETFALPEYTPFNASPGEGAPIYCIATNNIYVDSRFNYSLREYIVGTWIDGKSIYVRTLNIPIPTESASSLTESLVALGVHVDSYIEVKGTLTVEGWATQIPWGFPNLSTTGVILSAYTDDDVSGSKNKVGILYQGDLTIADSIFITVYYTKK